jgi:phospholipase C
MPEITRRRLLGSAAAGVAASLLPPSLSRAIAAGPQQGSLEDIEHVVVLMQENRSFDHYFGTLAGVRGFGDPNALVQSNGRPIFYQPDAQNPDGYLLPFHLDTHSTSSQAIPSTSHAWTVQHSSWNGGAMDNWLPAHLAADGQEHGPYTMGYYERQDIPFHFALAESFTLCDGYHCSVLGPTWPNRLYLMSASIDPGGTQGGPIISNVVPTPYKWTSYPERLTQAGVSWQVYQEEDDYGTNVLEFFASYQDAAPGSTLYESGLTISPPDQFERDAANGSLPTVSWLIPTSGQSEHPAYLPAAGADWVASKLEALAANRELWAKTVFILNYDENDGLFDHVPPPVPPAGTPEEFVGGLPIGGGIRVPCILISPWTVGGWVASEPFDHTSVLQLLERVTGVQEPNITDWRRQTFGDLTSALGFSAGRSFPRLPPTKPDLFRAEQEVASLPPATIPAAAQTPPAQDSSRAAPPFLGATAAAAVVGAHRNNGAIPRTAGRLEESATTHRGDFPDGMKDTVFPGRLAAVAGLAVAADAAVRAYVTGLVGGNVAVIDAEKMELLSAIAGETNPYGIAATPDGSKLYVANSGTNIVSVIDTTTLKSVESVVVGLYPHGVAASADGTAVYVANTGPGTGPIGSPGPGGSNTVSVIDVASDTVAQTIDVGQAPKLLAPTPDGSTLYVTCDDGLFTIDLHGGRVRSSDPALAKAHGLAVTPDGTQLFVTLPEADRVAVLETQSGRLVASIGVGKEPWGVVVTTDGSAAYVANANEDTLSVIDTASLAASPSRITVGHIPTALAATDDAVWVANNTSSTISVIDVASAAVTATIDLGLSDEPAGIALV